MNVALAIDQIIEVMGKSAARMKEDLVQEGWVGYLEFTQANPDADDDEAVEAIRGKIDSFIHKEKSWNKKVKKRGLMPMSTKWVDPRPNPEIRAIIAEELEHAKKNGREGRALLRRVRAL